MHISTQGAGRNFAAVSFNGGNAGGMGATDRRNTLGKSVSWSLILQGFGWPLIELPRDSTEFSLRMNGKFRSARQILP